MRRALPPVLALLLTLPLAAPAEATWSLTAQAATWTATGQLAVVQEARDAILWERMNRAFLGAVITAALPNLTALDNGDGTGTLRMVLPRPAADNWLTQYGSAGGCGGSPTQQQLLDCSDAAILSDIKQIVRRYRLSQVAEVEEPELQ